MRFPFGLFKRNEFRDMGRGIAARYQRCGRFWAPHLDLTKRFVITHARPCSKVAVLGAGRLLDLSLRALLDVASEVHLFDADPESVRHWRAEWKDLLGTRVIARHQDVTTCLDSWTSILDEVQRTDDIAGLLRGLRAPRPSWSDEPFGGVVSLNLLGQIPLYWRDRVLTRVSMRTSKEPSPQEGEALEISMGELQRAHLDALLQSSAAWRIVVTDTEYYYYRTDQSEWDVEAALFKEALGVFSTMQQQSSVTDRWLWHLAPQFVERDDYGEIHRVEAFALKADVV